MNFKLSRLKRDNIDLFRTFIYNNSTPSSRERFLLMLEGLDIIGAVSFLLLHEGIPYGAFLAGVRAAEGYISLIVTHPEQRGRGLGSLILSKGLSLLAGAGCKEVRLEVFPENEAALKLYHKAGFSITRELFTMRDESNSFFRRDYPERPTIVQGRPYTFQPIYRAIQKERNSWSRGLRSLQKMLEKQEAELYLLKEYNKISGYIVISREQNSVRINDLYLERPDPALLGYFLTSLLKGEKVVSAKEVSQNDPLLGLYQECGFYIDKKQYEMQKGL